MEQAQNGQPETVMVFVLDPMAHAMMIWTRGAKTTKVATLIKLPDQKKDAAKTAEAQARPAMDSRPQPVVTTEDFGDGYARRAAGDGDEDDDAGAQRGGRVMMLRLRRRMRFGRRQSW